MSSEQTRLLPKLVVILAICLAVIAPSAVASEETDVMAPVRQFVEGFNKKDVKMAEAVCGEEMLIIDDFSPHAWQGIGAVSKWFAAYEDYAKTHDSSEAVITLEKPRHIDVTGNNAYVVVPTGLRFRKKTEIVNETGVMTLVLHKAAKDWQITAWSWADN